MAQIEAEIRNGPIRVTIEANRAALKLFAQRQANAIVRVALQDGGEYFLRVFVPLRFSNYAKKLGYRPSPGYVAKKIRQGQGDVPFVASGAWRDATGASRCEATATKAKGRITLRIPQPHPITPVTSAQFRTVLPDEIERVARQVGNTLTSLLAERTETTSRKGTVRAALPATSRAALPPKPARTITTKRRAA